MSPNRILIRMGLNLAANALIGSLFGDIFSIWFRSNAKNAELLERYAGSEARSARHGGLALRSAGIISAVLSIGIGIIVAIVWLIGWLGVASGSGLISCNHNSQGSLNT